MATNGLLIAVRWEWDGTELTADAAAGVTVLNVLDSYALSIDETCWVGGTGPYTVTDQDEVADTITITPALSAAMRSEEHTSELQSLRHIVCRLLLERNRVVCGN